ncbi:MAG: hypothetical protein V3T83_03605 [Acidobacteriota bacterium]
MAASTLKGNSMLLEVRHLQLVQAVHQEGGLTAQVQPPPQAAPQARRPGPLRRGRVNPRWKTVRL